MLTTSIVGLCILAFSTAFPQGYGNRNFNQQHQIQRRQNVPGKNAAKQLPSGYHLENECAIFLGPDSTCC